MIKDTSESLKHRIDHRSARIDSSFTSPVSYASGSFPRAWYREISDSEGTKPVGFSHGDFGLAVQTIEDATEALTLTKLDPGFAQIIDPGSGDNERGIP